MHMSFFNIITYFLGNCKRAYNGRCLFKTSAGSGHILCAGVAAPSQSIRRDGPMDYGKQTSQITIWKSHMENG